MLTVDYRRLGLRDGDRVLDVGCGTGRHAFEAFRRGARVVAVDLTPSELPPVRAMAVAMRAAGQAGASGACETAAADMVALPFPDGCFDRVIAAEVLEHVADDRAAMTELARVLRPGGILAVTVPRFGPEVVCWALSEEYHTVPGGHLRIYRRSQLVDRLWAAGLELLAAHHAHGLHSPYWWLRCLVGSSREDHPLVRAYHRLLVWDITAAPKPTRIADALLNPVVGKSLVVYLGSR